MEKHLRNFLVLGTANAGTSSLYAYLKQHLDIYLTPDHGAYFFVYEGRDRNFRGPGVVADIDFLEVFFDAPLAVCEARATPRGIIRKLGLARSSISPESTRPTKHHQRPIYCYRHRVPHLSPWLRRLSPSCGSAVFSDYNRIRLHVQIALLRIGFISYG